MSLSDSVHATVSRILNEPAFAAEIKRMALAAVEGGAGSQAWLDYFDRFASTPGELAGLGLEKDGEPCVCNSNTYMTLSSLVTPVPTCCATTTTTTTSGNYFGREE